MNIWHSLDNFDTAILYLHHWKDILDPNWFNGIVFEFYHCSNGCTLHILWINSVLKSELNWKMSLIFSFKWPFADISKILLEYLTASHEAICSCNVEIMAIPIRNSIKLNQDQISNQNVNPLSKCIIFVVFLLISYFEFSLSSFPFFGRFNEIKMKCWIFVCIFRIRNYLNHCCFTKNCWYLSMVIVNVFVLFLLLTEDRVWPKDWWK